MIDKFGREITYMRLSVTDKCNLRCRYCMPAEGVCLKEHKEMLTEDEMITAVEAAASLGVKKLRITGGEPLVKKNIVSICRRAALVEGIEEVCLTTNGIFLPKLAEPLKDAGVKRINLSLDTLDPEKYAYILIQSGGMKKGDVLTVAQIAGVMGAKRTPDIIPMCHPILMDGINLELSLDKNRKSVEINATVSCDGRTGVEMEALTAVSTAALTVYDMCKAVQKDMVITDIRLLSKTGGVHGDYKREE